MPLIKNVRFWVLVALALISIYFLVSPYLFKQYGVVVSSIDKNANCTEIKEGDLISQVGGHFVKTTDEFKQVASKFKKDDYVALIVNNAIRSCYAIDDGVVGINAVDVESVKTIFGIEIQGGRRVTLRPESPLTDVQLKDAVEILNKRAKYIGMLQTTAELQGNKIKVTTLVPEKIGFLAFKGDLKGVVIEEIKLQNNAGKLFVGNETFGLELVGNKTKVLDSFYEVGETFNIDGIDFEIRNTTNSSVLLGATFLTNDDVKGVLPQEIVTYISGSRRYEFSIPVEIRNESSDNFVKIVKKIPTSLIGDRMYFNAFLHFYFDGRLLSQLNIPSDIVEKRINVFSVIGTAENKNDALNMQMKIDASLKGGRLPVTLEAESSERVEATGSATLKVIFALIFLLLIVFLFLVHVLFKNIKVGLFAGFLILLELVSMFGITAINQTYLGVAWLVDNATVMGMLILTFLIAVDVLITTGDDLKPEKYRGLFGKTKYLSILIMVLGICLLFTSFKNIGLVLFFGELVYMIVTKPIYADKLKEPAYSNKPH